MRLLSLLFCLLTLPVSAEVIVTETAPRSHGWWLGDTLDQRIELTLPKGAEIDEASLPRPRSVTYWLDLRRVRREQTERGVVLTLTWQNFYSALEPRLREVPGSEIRLTDGERVGLPGFEFVTSPIRPILAPSTPDQLRPDPPFRLVPLGAHRRNLVLSSLGLAVTLGLLASNQAWWPFHRRPDRPLTATARRISRLGDDAGDQRRQLLHRGLDASFGRVLIGPELPAFLEKRPEFRTLSDRLKAFFSTSDDRFFGPASNMEARKDDEDVASLAHALAAIERGRS